MDNSTISGLDDEEDENDQDEDDQDDEEEEQGTTPAPNEQKGEKTFSESLSLFQSLQVLFFKYKKLGST